MLKNPSRSFVKHSQLLPRHLRGARRSARTASAAAACPVGTWPHSHLALLCPERCQQVQQQSPAWKDQLALEISFKMKPKMHGEWWLDNSTRKSPALTLRCPMSPCPKGRMSPKLLCTETKVVEISLPTGKSALMIVRSRAVHTQQHKYTFSEPFLIDTFEENKKLKSLN